MLPNFIRRPVKTATMATDIKNLDILPEEAIITGSAGLVLHGIKLNRVVNDFDVILPYYIPMGDNEIDNKYPSACDFDYSVTLNGIKIDIRIDPKAKYKLINYNDKLYKVSPLHEILYYKAKYAMQGNGKHIDDIKTMLNGSITH